MTRLLILGSTGLLGSTILKYFSTKTNYECFGAIRKNSDRKKLNNINNLKLHKVIFLLFVKQ